MCVCAHTHTCPCTHVWGHTCDVHTHIHVCIYMCACLNYSGSCNADIRRCISVNRQLECKPLASDSICRQSAKTLPLRGIVKFLTTGTGLEPSPDPTRAVGCDWTSRVKTGTELDCLTTTLLLKGLWSGSKTQRSETGFHQGCGLWLDWYSEGWQWTWPPDHHPVHLPRAAEKTWGLTSGHTVFSFAHLTTHTVPGHWAQHYHWANQGRGVCVFVQATMVISNEIRL